MLKYVIVQAGGKGTRLEKYTANKPKALLSVQGSPLILNTMSKFSGSTFIIISDYKHELLRDYLRTFAKEKYVIVKANGHGTCAGLREALSYIPNGEPFILSWCDLYFSEEFELPNLDYHRKCYVGLSGNFKCRWSYKNGVFVEEPSVENGVAGFFIFSDKALLHDVPSEGEFVKYLSTKNIKFEPIILKGVREYGAREEYEELFRKGVARPFNKVLISDEVVIKEPVDKKGKELSDIEIAWYIEVQSKGYTNIPKIIDTSPLKLERLNAIHPFEMEPSKNVVEGIVNALFKLHDLERPMFPDRTSYYREYYQKTFERLHQVRHLIPHACQKEFVVNGKKVLNPFFIEEEIRKEVENYFDNDFTIIHGDPTFSNTMISKEGKVYFIDPRGYFGYTKIYGDPDYDFAKVYYSLVGNYDQFNRKRFKLKIEDSGVDLAIESNGYERFEELFFELVGNSKKRKIKLLHAIIWLSLTTYAWDDYDMICGAFYNGALKISEVLKC